MVDILSLETLTSPVAGTAILSFCLVGVATYFKQWLDRVDANASLREKDWIQRFEKQKVDCQAENDRLHQEIKDCISIHETEYKAMHAQFLELVREVGFLRGLHEGVKINNTEELKQYLIQ